MRKILLTLFLLAGIAWAADYHVFVFGDLTGRTAPGVYEQAVAECKRLNPAFALTVGDQVWGATSDEKELNRRWDAYFALTKGLGVPLYIAPGNNDIENAQMERIWRERTDRAPNYSFDYGGDHYAVLDTSRWNDSAALPVATLGWLREDLGQAQAARYRVVVMHRPIWLVSSLGASDDALIGIFRQYKVDLVLSGHIHYYVQKKAHGIIYISVPSSGGAIPPISFGAFYGYLWLTLADDGITWDAISLPAANK